jgi:hypothetical protein
MKYARGVFATAAMIMGIISPFGKVASAQGLPPGQLPVLTGQWWQWALSIPASVNPLLVQTGDNTCMIGQRGPIWFLAGIVGSESATRTCSVPEGTTLFFPAINTVDINNPQCGGSNETAEELQAEIQPFLNGIHSVSVTVDGQDVKKTLLRFVISNPFEVALPPENLIGCPSDIYSPVVDGGDYVSLPPLSLGAHTIHFHGESDYISMGLPQHFVQDVTYNLTVVRVSLK